jgi:F-box and WD-40 domain protein CDC4
LETGELLRYINAYLTAVSALQFDEDYIVTGGDDGIKIWDVRSGQLIRKALDQATGVWRLQFSPTKLISAIQNGETTSIEVGCLNVF